MRQDLGLRGLRQIGCPMQLGIVVFEVVVHGEVLVNNADAAVEAREAATMVLVEQTSRLPELLRGLGEGSNQLCIEGGKKVSHSSQKESD